MFWDRFTVLSITFVPAFVDSFWRGMIITLAVAFLVPRLRLGAASRHKLWLAILILICVLPFLSLFVGTSSLKSVGVRSFQASQPIFNVPLYAVQALLCSSITLSVIRMIALAGSIFSLLKLRKSSGEASIDLQKLLQQCVSEMNLKRSVSIRITSDVISPCLIGFIRPVILMPEKLMANLERQELRQILSHELAHLKRFDDWIILVQKIVSIVFSFHPAVLWIGKQMNLERELACDDSVIESGELPRSYALCLTRLAEFASTYAPPTTVSAGSQLSRRIDMLLNKKEIQHSAFLRVVQISGMSLILGCALWISQEGSLLAVSPEKENLVMSDPKNSFESAQQRFVEAKMRLEQAREEMLAAGEAMRNAQPESKARKEIERSIPETSSLPVLAPAAVMPPLPEAPSAPEAPPAVATPGEMKRPSAPPVPESLPSPALEAVPEAPPVPDVPPSLKVHNDRIK